MSRPFFTRANTVIDNRFGVGFARQNRIGMPSRGHVRSQAGDIARAAVASKAPLRQVLSQQPA